MQQRHRERQSQAVLLWCTGHDVSTDVKCLLVSDALNAHLEKLERNVESLNFREAKIVLAVIAEILDINLEQET